VQILALHDARLARRLEGLKRRMEAGEKL